MKRVLTAFLSLTAAVAAQGRIHYKFDSVGCPTIVNYARSPQASMTARPTNGALKGYGEGKFGPGSLRGTVSSAPGNLVDSGFEGPLTGSATIAFFVKNRYANTPSVRSGFIGREGFGIGTGGEAKGGLMTTGWGGPSLHLHVGMDLCYLSGWHHFAIVIDASAKKATWYWNGKAHKSESITASVNLPKGDPLVIGRDHIDACGSRYDLDEFRLTNRAVPASEILMWATKHVAAYAQYGTRPLAQHDHSVAGGHPVLGNSAYAVVLRASPQTPFTLALGLSRARFGTAILPIDLGRGMLWHTSILLWVPGVVPQQGEARLMLPIPEDPSFDQVSFHTQALFFGGTHDLATSNAITHTIGF